MKNKSACLVTDSAPKKIRVELVIDTETGAADVQLFDATEKLQPNQEIVVGYEAANEKLAEGFKLVEILRPRVPPQRYLLERDSALKS